MGLDNFQVAIQIRNKSKRQCRVRALNVAATSYADALAKLMPELLKRIQVDMRAELEGTERPGRYIKPKPPKPKKPSVWDTPLVLPPREPQPPTTPKPAPRAPAPPTSPKAPPMAPKPQQQPSKPAPRAPVAPRAPRAPVAPQAPKAPPIPEERAPVNMAYLGQPTRRKREPEERYQVDPRGLIKRKVVKAKPTAAEEDIFADLMVEE